MPDAIRKRFNTVNAVLDACATLPADDRLLVLEIAWLVCAKQARSGTSTVPGGFPTVQAGQVAELQVVAQLVQQDTPNPALDRLLQDGDYDAVAKHVVSLVKHTS
jgi:hypothetical protein